jgi:hypothetical protein
VCIKHGKQFFGLVAGTEVVGECNTFALDLLLAYDLKLFAALMNELVFVLWGAGGRVLV